MKVEPQTLKLYAVTDRSWLRPGESLSSVTEELLKGGVTCVQLREKQLNDEAFIREAFALKEVCDFYGVPLIINDRPDIARKVKAAGVHVGLSDMGIVRARELLGREAIIGASAHNAEEARKAQEEGADYLGCGAVFGSATKTNVSKLPLEELKRICEAVKIPAVAIGGITGRNIRELSGTGICGAAVISALYGAEDKREAAREFLRIWEEMQ